ncbi:myoneurin [Plakobranchus ocellatus]|uniref:Myoneurin n=1 Tax=Plakobranchus ocellatus TaxID=259542 RepID=A0AAV4DUZ6_9GAST|nr:myoneurin [Plakobranchus ocellatus]
MQQSIRSKHLQHLNATDKYCNPFGGRRLIFDSCNETDSEIIATFRDMDIGEEMSVKGQQDFNGFRLKQEDGKICRDNDTSFNPKHLQEQNHGENKVRAKPRHENDLAYDDETDEPGRRTSSPAPDNVKPLGEAEAPKLRRFPVLINSNERSQGTAILEDEGTDIPETILQDNAATRTSSPAKLKYCKTKQADDMESKDAEKPRTANFLLDTTYQSDCQERIDARKPGSSEVMLHSAHRVYFQQRKIFRKSSSNKVRPVLAPQANFQERAKADKSGSIEVTPDTTHKTNCQEKRVAKKSGSDKVMPDTKQQAYYQEKTACNKCSSDNVRLDKALQNARTHSKVNLRSDTTKPAIGQERTVSGKSNTSSAQREREQNFLHWKLSDSDLDNLKLPTGPIQAENYTILFTQESPERSFEDSQINAVNRDHVAEGDNYIVPDKSRFPSTPADDKRSHSRQRKFVIRREKHEAENGKPERYTIHVSSRSVCDERKGIVSPSLDTKRETRGNIFLKNMLLNGAMHNYFKSSVSNDKLNTHICHENKDKTYSVETENIRRVSSSSPPKRQKNGDKVRKQRRALSQHEPVEEKKKTRRKSKRQITRLIDHLEKVEGDLSNENHTMYRKQPSFKGAPFCQNLLEPSSTSTIKWISNEDLNVMSQEENHAQQHMPSVSDYRVHQNGHNSDPSSEEQLELWQTGSSCEFTSGHTLPCSEPAILSDKKQYGRVVSLARKFETKEGNEVIKSVSKRESSKHKKDVGCQCSPSPPPEFCCSCRCHRPKGFKSKSTKHASLGFSLKGQATRVKTRSVFTLKSQPDVSSKQNLVTSTLPSHKSNALNERLRGSLAAAESGPQSLLEQKTISFINEDMDVNSISSKDKEVIFHDDWSHKNFFEKKKIEESLNEKGKKHVQQVLTNHRGQREMEEEKALDLKEKENVVVVQISDEEVSEAESDDREEEKNMTKYTQDSALPSQNRSKNNSAGKKVFKKNRNRSNSFRQMIDRAKKKSKINVSRLNRNSSYQKTREDRLLQAGHYFIGDYLLNLWKKQVLCDVRVNVNNVHFLAHKIVLAAFSDVFTPTTPYPEPTLQFTIPNSTPEAVYRVGLRVFKYIYTATMDVKDTELEDTLRVGVFLGITEVKDVILEILSKPTIDNVEVRIFTR